MKISYTTNFWTTPITECELLDIPEFTRIEVFGIACLVIGEDLYFPEIGENERILLLSNARHRLNLLINMQDEDLELHRR